MPRPGQKALHELKVSLLTLLFLLDSTIKVMHRRRRGAAQRLLSDTIQSAPENAIAIDCGANVGLITGMFLEKGFRVHAFEPDPVAAELLIERYGEDPNLIFHPVAVGTAAARQPLFRRREFRDDPVHYSVSSSLLEKKDCDPRNSVEVEVVDFIEFLRGIPEPVWILKMDIEGAEIGILQRLLDTGLHRKIRLIIAETHGRINLGCRWQVARIRARIQANRLSNFNLDHR